MSVQLEIRDGNPNIPLSPDIWVVEDPNSEAEIQPIANQPCYIMAKVRNNGSSAAINATVKFYWGDPSIGITRATANFVGSSNVNLGPGDVQNVLCLTQWVPTFLNDGHECLLAEAYHDTDMLGMDLNFNVEADRRVAQKNLSVLEVAGISFFMPFQMHNPLRKNGKFTAVLQQTGTKQLEHFPLLQKKLKGKREGKLITAEFNEKNCPSAEKKVKGIQSETKEYELGPHAKKQLSVSGSYDGDFVFLTISLYAGKQQTGGLGILIIKNKSHDNSKH